MSEKMFKSDKALQDSIDEYFDDHSISINEETGEISFSTPPTIAGLTLHLGFADRQSLYDYKKNPIHSYTIKKAITRMEEFAEQSLMAGSKPTGAIFWLKNHGWSDKQEIEHSGEVTQNIVKWGDVMGGDGPEA